jgi:hypothetical protein
VGAQEPVVITLATAVPAAYALAVIGSEGRDALCELVVRSPDGYAREMAREALDRAVVRRSA